MSDRDRPEPPARSGTVAPMRIAIGIHSLQLGGSQIGTVELARALRGRGHDVHVFAIHEEFKVTIVPIAERSGIDIEVLPAESTLWSQAARITEVVDRRDAQVLHVFHEDHWLGPLAAIALRARPGRGLVVTNWNMENNRWLPLHAPLILGTEALRDEAEGLQRGPVWLLEPPVDLDRDRPDPERSGAFRSELGVADDEVLVVLVSRVDRVMKLDGIVRTIKAVERLARPDVRLVIVGDGNAMDTVRDHAASANESLGREAVVVAGAMHDPRPAYDAADIVAGMGGSALRGLAFGKALVVLGEEGFSEVFEPDTVDGFLRHGFHGVGPDDADGERLAEQLRSLLDPERRAELAAFGSSIVKERFALDVLAERLERIYSAAIEQPLSAPRRWADVAYVTGYDLAHRKFPPGLRQAIRRRVPRLRTG